MEDDSKKGQEGFDKKKKGQNEFRDRSLEVRKLRIGSSLQVLKWNVYDSEGIK